MLPTNLNHLNLNTCCFPPVRYCCNTLPPVHNAGSGSGRGAGLPPQARRGRHGDVFSWQVHRWDAGYCKHVVWTDGSFFLFRLVKPVLTSLCTGSNYIATLTLGSAGAHASYYHKANEQVTRLPFTCTCLSDSHGPAFKYLTWFSQIWPHCPF